MLLSRCCFLPLWLSCLRHTYTHTHTHSLTHSSTHSLTHSLTHTVHGYLKHVHFLQEFFLPAPEMWHPCTGLELQSNFASDSREICVFNFTLATRKSSSTKLYGCMLTLHNPNRPMPFLTQDFATLQGALAVRGALSNFVGKEAFVIGNSNYDQLSKCKQSVRDAQVIQPCNVVQFWLAFVISICNCGQLCKSKQSCNVRYTFPVIFIVGIQSISLSPTQ